MSFLHQAHPLWNQTYVGALSPSSASATHGALGCGKQDAFVGDPLRDPHDLEMEMISLIAIKMW